MNLDALIREFWRMQPGERLTTTHRITFWAATVSAWAFVGALGWAILTLAFLI